ncbi:MAG TPA: ABC transporter permease subunit [Ignavibacteria bacterium]
MINLIYYELLKIFKKWRTYIGFIAIGILIPLIEFVLYFSGQGIIENTTKRLEQDFILVGNLFNGWFVTHLIMNSLWIHIPFLICLVAGDVLAGEASAGTYRILLIRPVSRNKILISKYIATLIYTLSLVFFLAFISLGLGLLLLGTGDLLIFKDGLLILPQDELWFRFFLSFLFASYAMCVVSTLAFLFSSLVENSIGPIIGTMAVIIFFFIIGNLPYDFFITLKPYLFTTYLDVWTLVFDEKIDWSLILKHILILSIYMLSLFLPTYLLFRKKDILS